MTWSRPPTHELHWVEVALHCSHYSIRSKRKERQWMDSKHLPHVLWAKSRIARLRYLTFCKISQGWASSALQYQLFPSKMPRNHKRTRTSLEPLVIEVVEPWKNMSVVSALTSYAKKLRRDSSPDSVCQGIVNFSCVSDPILATTLDLTSVQSI